MSSLIVVKIHNNSLGRMFSVKDEAEGIQFIKGMAEDQLERELTVDEMEELENNLELFNDEDHNNEYCWAIGKIEDV
jgi:hypothetical protein